MRGSKKDLEFMKFVIEVKKSKKGLHSIVEQRLEAIFKELYPDAFVKIESCSGIVGGRADMIAYLKEKAVHIEFIASKGRVHDNVKRLKESQWDIKLVILMDHEIEPEVGDKYFDELRYLGLSLDHFPRFKLSNVLLKSREEEFKKRLREILDSKLNLKEKPLPPSLHNQTPPEPNFVGRKEMLEAITSWYKSPEVKIGALVGFGGFGKSALARRWYDSLEGNKIHPDGIFWWGFYRNPYLDRFLDELLRYLAHGRIDLSEVRTSWQKAERIKEFLTQAEYLIILDGLEEMQKKAQSEELGAMEYPEFREILTYIADANFRGLCLITTRFPLPDVETYPGYKKLDVEELSKEDTRALFRKVGVSGNNEEIDETWEEFKGHTLSLVLLAHYLAGSDIKKAKEIPPFYSDKEAGGKAHRILLWYDKQLKDEQRLFMKIFSLFRIAVGESEFEAIFLPKIKMKVFHFNQMVKDLEKRRLITKGDNTYTTHPLIKGYFESIFDEKEKKLCHKAIYEYFGKIAPDKPETLEEMQPVFEQVYHGCSAGLYDEVWEEVYRKKIYQEYAFLTHQLGGWKTQLSLIKTFFLKGDLSQMPLATKKNNQSWLLNLAGLTLYSIGQPEEAKDLLIRQINLVIENESWEDAAVGYQNLAAAQFMTGELEKVLENSKRGVEMAERAKSEVNISHLKTYVGYILHLLGRSKEAEEWFKQADELKKKSSGHRLSEIWGVFYANFLISLKRIDEALELTTQNLKIRINKGGLADFSRCYRTLGAIERIKGNYKKAEAYLQKAFEFAKKTEAHPHIEIEALLESGRLDLEKRKYEAAISSANQVLKLCQSSGFKLWEPEAELILARAFLAQGDKEKAKSLAQSAYSKANQMHYRIIEKEAEKFLAEIN